jgi:hypothetical protein
LRPSMLQHAHSAHRLYGPANVGFVFRTKRRLELRLCAERYWCEIHGLNNGSIANKNHRSGNGDFRAVQK